MRLAVLDLLIDLHVLHTVVRSEKEGSSSGINNSSDTFEWFQLDRYSLVIMARKTSLSITKFSDKIRSLTVADNRIKKAGFQGNEKLDLAWQ